MFLSTLQAIGIIATLLAVSGCTTVVRSVAVEFAVAEHCAESGSRLIEAAKLEAALPELKASAPCDSRALVLALEAEWLLGFSILDASGESSEGLDRALEHFRAGERLGHSALVKDWQYFDEELGKSAPFDGLLECDIRTRVEELRGILNKQYPIASARPEHPAVFALLALHMAQVTALSGGSSACSSLATTMGVMEHAVDLEEQRRDLFLDRTISCPGSRGIAHLLSVVLAEIGSRFRPDQRRQFEIDRRTSLARAWLGDPRWMDYVLARHGGRPIARDRLCRLRGAPPGLYNTPLHRFLRAAADTWYSNMTAEQPCP